MNLPPATALAASQADNDAWALFELAPTSLWLEDFSQLVPLYARWRTEGVTDFRAHLESQPERVAECTRCLQVLRVNQATLTLFGAANQDELLQHLPGLLGEEMRQRQIRELEQLWLGHTSYEHMLEHRTIAGERLDVQLRVRILPGHEQDWSRVLVSIEDHTERERARRELARAQEYARGLFDNSPISLWVEDFSAVHHLLQGLRAQGVNDLRAYLVRYPEFVRQCMAAIRVLDVNQQTLRVFAAPSKEVLVQRLTDVFRDEMEQPFSDQLVDLWHGRLFQQRETVNYALDGEQCHFQLQFAVVPGHEHDWSLVQISLTDISARKKAEAYLQYLGKHDLLTRLCNRTFFVEEMKRLEARGPWPVAMLMIDLNGLKRVNDEGGHAVGDALLRRAGEVLGKAVERPASVSRTGGDEFVVLLPGKTVADATRLSDEIVRLVGFNNQYHHGQPVLSLSMGAAQADKGESIEAALHHADMAMYADKTRYYAAQGARTRGEGG